MKNIVLIGMPGTGKSTVGKLLATRLGCPLIDTDRLIEDKTRKTLPEALAELGVAGFLQLEGDVGISLQCQGSVVATGGSMVFCDEAMQNLAKQSVIVWLDTDVAELERRICSAADRGIAAEPWESVAQIDAVRRPLYQKYADLHVMEQGAAIEAARAIEKALADMGETFPDIL